MDATAMKSAGVFFILTFAFFFIGQAFWTYGIFFDSPLLATRELDQNWSSHAFTLSSILGLIASVKLYKAFD